MSDNVMALLFLAAGLIFVVLLLMQFESINDEDGLFK